MSLTENAIPLLEYDTDPGAVIPPSYEHPSLRLPKKAVFAFLGEAVDRYARAHGAVVVDEVVTISKRHPVYVLTVEGQEVCLVEAPLGAPAAAIILDAMLAHGVQEVISSGSCGVLVEMEENVFLVPTRALRDEGTSYHYLPPSRFVDISAPARRAVEETLRVHGLPYTEAVAWTTDGFYRETAEKVSRRKREGCTVVEMESAALAAVAQMRGAVWGTLLYTADTLADLDHYDDRGWGMGSVDRALALAVEAVLRI